MLFDAVIEHDAIVELPVGNICGGIEALLTLFNNGFPVTVFEVLIVTGVLETIGGLTPTTGGCITDVTTLLGVHDVLLDTVFTIVGLVVTAELVDVGCTLANVVDALRLTIEVTI